MNNNFLGQKPVRFKDEENRFREYAERCVGDALENGKDAAAVHAQEFVSIEEGSQRARAYYLHSVNSRWKDIDDEGESFWSWAKREISKNPETIKRDVCVWEWLSGEYIPSEYRDGIEDFSVKMLKLAYGVSIKCKRNKRTGQYEFLDSGLEITSTQWRNMVECADESMLLDVIRDINGKEPNSNRVAFKIDDKGVLWFFRGKKDSATIGGLSVNHASPLVRDGIAELLERAKITEFEND